MIKRRFYRADHGDRDGGSSDSSSSSDSDIEAQSAEDSDTQPQPQPQPEPDTDVEADQSDGDDDDDDPSLKPQSPLSSSSGYESEDSSANEIDAESGGLLANDDDGETGRDSERLDNIFSRKVNGTVEETLATDPSVADVVPSCVLKCKSVFKCRICPKIVCLNEESLNTHLKSKRHARSEKLLKNGRLKRILNSDGEEEVVSDDDGETHAERHARIVALAQNTDKKKSRGRQRQRQRLKRKNQNPSSNIQNNGQQKDNCAKRRRKNVD